MEIPRYWMRGNGIKNDPRPHYALGILAGDDPCSVDVESVFPPRFGEFMKYIVYIGSFVVLWLGALLSLLVAPIVFISGKERSKRLWKSLDHFAQVGWLDGPPGITISAMLGKNNPGHIVCVLLDKYVDKNHCEDSAKYEGLK